MNKGKISEQVLERSVLRNINKKTPLIAGAEAHNGFSAAKVGDEIIVTSVDTVVGGYDGFCRHAIIGAANGVASSGAHPMSVQVSAVLNIDTEEKYLKELARDIQKTCEEIGVYPAGGHTELSEEVSLPIITVSCMGAVKRNVRNDWAILNMENIKPGDSIIVSRDIALEATSIIAKEKEAELEERFSPDFIAGAKMQDKFLSVIKEAGIAYESGASAMYDVSEGGIFAALWRISSGARCGFDVNIKDIPIRQDTIEICEFFGLNPYMILSGGSMIAVTSKADILMDNLSKAGIEASVIGQMNDTNAKRILNGEEIRYLDKPLMDEIRKIVR